MCELQLASPSPIDVIRVQPVFVRSCSHVWLNDWDSTLHFRRSQDASRQGLAAADLPLRTFLNEAVVPYESDEVTRLIIDNHDRNAFAAVAHLTVGGLRDWLLADETTAPVLKALAPGLTPEIVAAVSKICRLQDLMAIAAKCSVVTAFRDTLGLPGRLSVRLQPNHPTDDARGIAASIFDGLLLGAGDAVIGINPATDSPASAHALLSMLDEIITSSTFRRKAACWRTSRPRSI